MHFFSIISCSDVFHLHPTKVDTGGGSPVDVARSYMKSRSRWASSGRNTELKTPSTVSSKVFQEETLCATGHYSVSSSEVCLLIVVEC